MQQYSVTSFSIELILSWVKSGEIAIPEIQRPFVWDSTKVRNLLDSLYLRYPVGYLISWKNPNVKLKDGSSSAGKKVLIDGQQRVTALMASILGTEILTKEYVRDKIRIAFNPIEERFEVKNPAIEKNPIWISDISIIFSPTFSTWNFVNEYLKLNPDTNAELLNKVIDKLRNIIHNEVGVIELNHDLDIDKVTEIFIRVNSSGAQLSQADFAMSKIAVNEVYDGNTLRKAIDYFCHMAIYPDFFYTIQKNDEQFCKSDFFKKMAWLKDENDDIYDPSYTDMLRVAFTTEFKRGKLQDLVALLSGRNFESKQYEESIVQLSFNRLRSSILLFMNETNFKQFVLIIRSAGFVSSSLIGSQNALNFAYIIYLTLRAIKEPKNNIESYVRRWFVFSTLTGRYSASPESTFDYDIRQIHSVGFKNFADVMFDGELSDSFWDIRLPKELETSVSSSPLFRVFIAAQVKLGDKGFLSKDISTRELIEVKSDVHHIFPKDFLKKHGYNRSQYNQIANYAITQSEINIAIGNKAPNVYINEVFNYVQKGKQKYGNISDIKALKTNFVMNCIPDDIVNYSIDDYNQFLECRRLLMAKKIKKYFSSL